MLRFIHLALAALSTLTLRAAMPPEQVEFFEKKVRPVLAEQCYKCHGPEKQKAELRLDSRAAILKGSDNGPVVVPGQPDKSSLIKSIRHEGDMKMPEKAPKMPDDQIAALTEWVKLGAPWPENDKPAASNNNAALVKTHWSFQPIRNWPVPAVKDAGKWAQDPLDRFVLAKLEAKNLPPSPIASRYTLIRRASFTLTGLPPTDSEVQSFEKDPAPTREAFAKVVDRLLASPRYGESWGRHWLDVARYADHRGYLAGNDSREYPFAWTYRDWVIRVLNEDLPYDQFLVRQLAADLPGSGAKPEDLAALGFLTLGRRFLNDQNLIIDDRIDVTIRGMMALTVGCARCHDHKFDPISMKDYYAIYGVFASCDEEKDPGKLPLLPGGQGTPAYEQVRADRVAELRAYDKKIATHVSLALQFSHHMTIPLPGAIVEPLIRSRFFTRKLRDERKQIETRIAQAELNPGSPPRAHTLFDRPSPVKQRVFIRGNPGRPGEEVPRRFISFLGGDAQPFSDQSSGRLELARAIASKDNPLTARVIVNRVWAHHFGTGLVRTPGDFGAKSDPPVQGDLLDHLATQFIANGWSLKKLHREILLSATWMQESATRPDHQQLDPDNRLLAHQNRQRLTWEQLHDALLAAAGELDGTMYGRPVQLFKEPTPKRRAIYAYIDRQNLPATLRTFDFASPDLMNPQRAITSVPQQALYMMNSPFVLARAADLVDGPEFASSGVEEPQVQELFERVFARKATRDEVAAAIAFVKTADTTPRDAAAPTLWQYGYGRYDGAKQRMSFTPLPHWTGSAWQGGPKLPDDKLSWCLLTADGGHPGRDLAVIKRFTSPRDMSVSLAGRVHRLSEPGNGVLARIVSGRQGQLAEWVIEPKGASGAPITNIDLKTGETLDFVIESRGDENSDNFQWRALLRATDGTLYGSQTQFHGPAANARPLSPWQKFAQVLLETNEFAFVD
jgi:hypothetical protein